MALNGERPTASFPTSSCLLSCLLVSSRDIVVNPDEQSPLLNIFLTFISTCKSWEPTICCRFGSGDRGNAALVLWIASFVYRPDLNPQLNSPSFFVVHDLNFMLQTQHDVNSLSLSRSFSLSERINVEQWTLSNVPKPINMNSLLNQGWGT